MAARMTALLSILPALLCAACPSAPVPDVEAPVSSARLQAVVEKYLEDRTEILGTVVRVRVEGTGSYEAASGFTDLSRANPIEPDTRFVIGSVTKLFTAVLVLQLVERGQVRLDDPIREHLPPGWSAILAGIDGADAITVDQALSHRSGIADVTNSEAFERSLYADSTIRWKPLDILKMTPTQTGEEFRPGESFGYSNTNYILLGALIEHVSGLPYRQALQRNILDRVGLENTFLIEESLGSRDDAIARGYSRVGGVPRDGRGVYVAWAQAAGGIVSTAGDLVAFYTALASGELFDDPSTYRRMCQRVGYNETYGRGVEIVDDPEVGLYYGHRGNFMGTRSILAHFPADGITVVVSHTYDGFSMSHPAELMKRIVHSVRGDAPAAPTEPAMEGPEILADTSGAISNPDSPPNGAWDFAPLEEWSVDRLAGRPLGMVGALRIDDDGAVYVLDRASGTIDVLDPDGTLRLSFGGFGDGPRLESPVDVFVTPSRVHVLDIGRSGDKIKTYDKSGNWVATTAVEAGVSPRRFLDDDRYLAVRSGPDVLNRPTHELLQILSLTRKTTSTLAKFPAEDKLILQAMVPMGRFVLLEDDIDVFPRLIVHSDGDKVYLGRSDEYLLERVDLDGGEVLAFAIPGRERKALPPGFAENRADRTTVADKEMTAETRAQFLARFPRRQVHFTKIATDGQGLIYVFVPSVSDPATQSIDIFSPEGRYLHRAVVEFPDGWKRIRPPEIRDGHMLALLKDGGGATRLVEYRIRRPRHPRPPLAAPASRDLDP